MTRSSRPTPAARSATCRAAVPLCIATAYGALTAWANAVSNRSTNGPTYETQFVSMHSWR